jgi:hypothetical protein
MDSGGGCPIGSEVGSQDIHGAVPIRGHNPVLSALPGKLHPAGSGPESVGYETTAASRRSIMSSIGGLGYSSMFHPVNTAAIWCSGSTMRRWPP